MKKVWNKDTRQYDFVVEGIWIVNDDYSAEAAEKKWLSRYPTEVRKRHLKSLMSRYVEQAKSFTEMRDFFEAVEQHFIDLNHAYVYNFRGRQSPNKPYDSIPDTFKPAIEAIAKQLAGGYSRGRHTTCPSVSHSPHPCHEFQLLPTGTQTDSRATTALHENQLFIYYSEGHAFGTYNYHLVTFPHGKDKIEMPLTGGARDALIKRPFDV